MASLSTKEIAVLRARVCDLDAKYASLCAEEQLCMKVEKSKAAVLCEIQMISQLISECEKELARPQVAVARPPMAIARPQVAVPQIDSPQLFLEGFLGAVQLMASSGVPSVISNYVITGKYLPVRGDGNCGLRAFLTALAARAGIYLSCDPLGMLEWISRLKPLMIQEINQMLSTGIIVDRNLLSIPENRFGAGATLHDYFALFLTDGYQITNFDFRVLASMFNLQINVIRQNTNGIDDVQCFVRPGNEIDLIIKEHICILQQTGHYVPIIQVCEYSSSESIEFLYNARALGFTG